jgi:hypothetical protein
MIEIKPRPRPRPRAVGKQKPRQLYGEGAERTIESRGPGVLCECYGMTKLGLDESAKWRNESTLCDCVDWYAAILPCSLGCMSLGLPVLSACAAGSCATWDDPCVFAQRAVNGMLLSASPWKKAIILEHALCVVCCVGVWPVIAHCNDWRESLAATGHLRTSNADRIVI